MKPSNPISKYVRVMSCINIGEQAQQQIIKNCARYSTMKKIKAGRFKLTAVKKDRTIDKVQT